MTYIHYALDALDGFRHSSVISHGVQNNRNFQRFFYFQDGNTLFVALQFTIMFCQLLLTLVFLASIDAFSLLNISIFT